MSKEYDPKMHSAEHILNQTMVRMFDKGRSFSNHIEKKKSKCDYHFDRPLSEEDLKAIESKVNEEIAQDHTITEEFISRSEAGKRFNLDRLPDSAGDEIRIIRIGDYDACPCSGIHAESSGQIGSFRIISSSYADGVLRIRFKLD